MDSRFAVERDLAAALAAQAKAVAAWHEAEPEGVAVAFANPAEQLEKLVLAQHLMNFRLWHTEDVARRKDVDAAVIADCKYRIDVLNQKRTDAFEAVDACLVARLERLIPPLKQGERARHNTESLGMAVDRMSILALKIFHMAEQAAREDADENHRQTCAGKLAVLEEQRGDLEQAIFDLIADFCSGVKRPKAYYQFKMYNDPALNPQLYGKK